MRFPTPQGEAQAVRGVSYALQRGRTLCLVGESGCGKSISALSILRLLPSTFRTEGRIGYKQHQNLLTLPERELRKIRGGEIAFVFQEPQSALNPLLSVGEQLLEALRQHQPQIGRRQARRIAAEWLTRVGIAEAEQRLQAYPHQLSGGLCQRVLIAMALISEPAVLIADEPTTALDATIQAQLLHLLATLQGELGLALLLITHDLGVVAQMADEVLVMYAGEIVERSDANALFRHAAHPYTEGLLKALPARLGDRHSQSAASAGRTPLTEMPGQVPAPHTTFDGCAFATRCPQATAVCHHQRPPWQRIRPRQEALCWHPLVPPVADAASGG